MKVRVRAKVRVRGWVRIKIMLGWSGKDVQVELIKYVGSAYRTYREELHGDAWREVHAVDN